MMAASPDALLHIAGLKVAYGGIQAVKGIDLEIRQGELVALIGANGAGKTTSLQGHRRLASRRRRRRSTTWAAARAACRRTSLVRQGLVDGARRPRHIHPHDRRRKPADGRVCPRSTRPGRGARPGRACTRPFRACSERAEQLAGTLSGGEQQMLAMARALMSRPKLLLLDEPSMGLSPIMVEKIFDVIRSASARGMTDTAGRAKRPAGAGSGRPRVCARFGHDHAERRRRRAAARPQGARSLPGRIARRRDTPPKGLAPSGYDCRPR